MKLSGLHILLTYQCTYECDHCFVWGSPWQTGTLTLGQIKQILEQAKEADIASIYFEGGEPFFYYAILVKGVRLAARMGFHVGVVSNAYWARTVGDALAWLKPLAGRLADLTVSNDLYHYSEEMSRQAQNAQEAARRLGIPVDLICVAQPEEVNAAASHGMIQSGASAVMYRGRAAVNLSTRATRHPWERFDSCPHEDLREPGRVHLDPFGNLHVCQGLVIGNLFEKPLKQICEEYDADDHPICGSLLEGGPAALVKEYNLAHDPSYADACHLCYEMRRALRERFPALLAPDQMYGVME